MDLMKYFLCLVDIESIRITIGLKVLESERLGRFEKKMQWSELIFRGWNIDFIISCPFVSEDLVSRILILLCITLAKRYPKNMIFAPKVKT